MNIFYSDGDDGSPGPFWVQYLDRAHNTYDFHDRERAEEIARRLAESYGLARVMLGGGVLAEFHAA